jgi:hypothetical protein
LIHDGYGGLIVAGVVGVPGLGQLLVCLWRQLTIAAGLQARAKHHSHYQQQFSHGSGSNGQTHRIAFYNPDPSDATTQFMSSIARNTRRQPLTIRDGAAGTAEVSTTPEPMTLTLLGLGAIDLLRKRRN